MRKRRGLSTVVGAVFFVIAATTTIAYVSYSMNAISDFSQSVIVLESENVNRGNERIEISSVTIDGGKFNVTVVNTGSLAANLTRLWVTNESLSPPTHERGNLNQIINTGKSVYNIGQSLGISASTTDAYTLKVVTGRGNFASHQVFNNPETLIKLITPGTVLPDILFTVTSVYVNNSTVSNTITDLTPTINIESGSATLQPGYPKPSLIKSLSTNDVALVTWLYDSPTTDQTIQLNASYTNAPVGVWDDSTTVVEAITESQSVISATFADQVRKLSVLAGVLPNPLQTVNNDLGKFSILVINPLDRDVEIYAIGISSPSTKIFKNNDFTAVEPTTGWVAKQFGGGGNTSILMWEANGNPITVTANSMKQFRVESKNKGPSAVETDLIIEALTSEGKLLSLYAMSGESAFPTMNVYFSTDSANPKITWTGLITNVPDGVQTTYNATVHNASPATDLDTEVALTIMIPKDFTNVSADPQSSWDDIIILSNQDGSTLIKVNTTSTFFNQNRAEVFSFNATAPVVTTSKLYVFQTTALYPNCSCEEISAAIAEVGVEVVP